MSVDISVKVGGVWLDSIGKPGDLAYSHALDGGCKDASFTLALPPAQVNPLLRQNVLVELLAGSKNLWMGRQLEPTPPDGDTPWTFNAQGLSAEAAKCLCFDSSHNTTSTPDTAIDQGIADGFLRWKRPTSISSVAYGSATDQTTDLNYLDSLMGGFATGQGKWWGVDADAQVYVTAGATTPTWHLVAGGGRLGSAGDDYASDLWGRFLNPSGGYQTAHRFDAGAQTYPGPASYGVDLTSLGMITLAQANAVLDGMLAKGKARLGYANSVTVGRNQLLTPGGTPAALDLVLPGDKVRMFGALDEQTLAPLPFLDWTIGEVARQAGSDTIDLTPLGLVDRDLTTLFSVGDAA